MKNINYTFVIPHKNSINLLQRCLDSIPLRDDIQIIVVDDNSSYDVLQWNAFRKKNNRVDFIFTHENKGAGYARNVGIRSGLIVGKWILFPDADDYYSKNFLNVLDVFLDSSNDVIYFNADCVDKEMGNIKNNLKDYQSYFKVQNFSFIKFRSFMPWNKMISRRLIDDKTIRFEEVMQGNDVFFSLQIGYFAHKVEFVSDRLYVYVINCNSISHRCQWNFKFATTWFLRQRNLIDFYIMLGREEWNSNTMGAFLRGKVLSEGWNKFFVTIFAYIASAYMFLAKKNRYTNKFM